MTQPPFPGPPDDVALQDPPALDLGGPPTWPGPNPAPDPIRGDPDPGLDQPWYGIGFLPAVIRPFKKYAMFKGRASRGEYWWFFLAVFLLNQALGMVLSAFVPNSYAVMNGFYRDYRWTPGLTVVFAISGLIGAVLLLPQMALAVRRLHDSNKPGIYYLWCFAPLLSMLPLALLLGSVRADAGFVLSVFVLLSLAQLGCSIWFIVLMATRTYPGPTKWDIPGPGEEPKR